MVGPIMVKGKEEKDLTVQTSLSSSHPSSCPPTHRTTSANSATPRPKHKSAPSRTSNPPALFHRPLPLLSLRPRLFRTLVPESPRSSRPIRRHLSPIHTQPALPACYYRNLGCRGVVVTTGSTSSSSVASVASNNYSPPPFAFPTFMRGVEHVLLHPD